MKYYIVLSANYDNFIKKLKYISIVTIGLILLKIVNHTNDVLYQIWFFSYMQNVEKTII